MVILQKRGQLEISFQLIFSLILIAVFLYAAMVGIKYFMNTAEHAKINSFIAELDSRVENAWTATEISQSYELPLSSNIKYVCFASPNTLTATGLKNLNISECSDFNTYLSAFKNMNMFFCPASAAWKVGAPIYVNIDCRGKDCLVFPKSPYCIKNDGKVKIKLEKNYGEKKITLS